MVKKAIAMTCQVYFIGLAVRKVTRIPLNSFRIKANVKITNIFLYLSI